MLKFQKRGLWSIAGFLQTKGTVQDVQFHNFSFLPNFIFIKLVIKLTLQISLRKQTIKIKKFYKILKTIIGSIKLKMLIFEQIISIFQIRFINFNSKMLKTILLWAQIFIVINSLHYLNPDKLIDDRFNLLKGQQRGYEDKVKKILANISSIEQKIAKEGNNSQKVLILQQAIIAERNQLNKVSDTLLPPFTMSKKACNNLSASQKAQLLKEVESAKNSIKQFRQISAQIPSCNKLTELNADINKQELFILSLQKAINSKCEESSILSQTIWQTNVYASNWVLGSQTFDQLIDQYYERSSLFDNVTNCPLSNPFYNGEVCSQCPQSSPVFVMSTKKCISCQQDYQVDNELKKCVKMDHFTDYKNKQLNYALDGAAQLPSQLVNGRACNKKTPFYNGSNCVSCPLPKYWSVSSQKCKQCPIQQQYDINTHNCALITTQRLTILQNTNWVTSQNISKIYVLRAQILKQNETTKKYLYCPTNTPYFDGIQCIKCQNEFNIDQNHCSNAKDGQVYNKNVKSYVKPESNRQTNYRAENYISFTRFIDSDIPDCDIITPFYDGISCIMCSEPAYLFDISENKCISCPANTFFKKNKDQHLCLERPILFITKSQDRLLATTKKSLLDYKQETQQKIKNSPQAIVKQCPINTFSKFTNCIECPAQQYFNIQIKDCVNCDGSLSQTHLCIQKAYLVTNLEAKRIVGLSTSVEQEKIRIKSFIESHPNSKICPLQTPYSNNQKCIVCKDPTFLFNYTSLTCVKCSPGTIFSVKTQTCQQIVYLNNLKGQGIILKDGQSISQLQNKQQKQISQSRIKCPEDNPFTSNGKQCFTCSEPNNLFNISSLECTKCQINEYYNKLKMKCERIAYITNINAKNLLESGQSTYAKLISQQDNIKKISKYEECPVDAPYSTGYNCIACNTDNKYFNLQTKSCNKCPENLNYVTEARRCLQVYFLTDLTSDKLIEVQNFTISNSKTEQQKLKNSVVTILCTGVKPFSDGNSCISCSDSTPYFNLKTKQCENCQKGKFYLPTLHICGQKTPITYVAKADLYIQSDDYKISKVLDEAKGIQEIKKYICPELTPYSNGKQCIKCENQLPYFDLKSKQCIKCMENMAYDKTSHRCKPLQIVTNTKDLKNYIETQTVTLQTIQKQINEIPPNLQKICTVSEPFSNGQSCIKCLLPLPYFNLQNKKCESCPSGTQYSEEFYKCKFIIPHYPNLSKSNWIVNDENPFKILNLKNQLAKNSQSLQCPQSTPHYDQSKKICLSCQNQQLFNYDTNKCEKCILPKAFDINVRTCLQKKGDFQTQLTKPNLILGGISKTQYQDEYSSNIQSNGKIQNCPTEKPYYDGISCIQCPSQLPYFNMKFKVCQICENSSIYKQSLKECIHQNGQTVSSAPNISKMFANIF